MQRSDKKEASNIPGIVEFLVWANPYKAKGLDPSAYAAIMGGNVGHTAIKVTVPIEAIETNPDAEQQLSSLSALLSKEIAAETEKVITKTEKIFSVNGNPVIKPCYEIYFSFWPSEDKSPYSLASYEEDTLREWQGRESPPMIKRKGKRVFGENDEQLEKRISSNVTETRRGVLSPANMRKKTRTKPVYSGHKEVLHFDPNLMLHRLEKDIQKNMVNLKDRLEHESNDGDTVTMLEVRLLGLESKIIKLDHFKKEVQKNGWNETNLNQLVEDMEQRVSYYTKINGDNQFQKQIDKFKAYSRTIKTGKTIGINPDIATYFQPQALDILNILHGMEIMAGNKYGTLGVIGWNCASSALYVLLQGAPDAVKHDKEMAALIKKFEKGKTPLYTPKEAGKVADMLQRKITEYKMEDIRRHHDAILKAENNNKHEKGKPVAKVSIPPLPLHNLRPAQRDTLIIRPSRTASVIAPKIQAMKNKFESPAEVGDNNKPTQHVPARSEYIAQRVRLFGEAKSPPTENNDIKLSPSSPHKKRF